MKNILISGVNGFLGKNLIAYLSESEYRIFKLGRAKLHQDDYSWQDLNELDHQEFDTIVHLAGKAHDLKNTAEPDEYYKINFELTKALYNKFLKSNAKHFIFISSVKASADTVENILTEEDIPQPITHYGKSKLMAEEYIEQQILPEGKSYFIIRPCMIHGPGNKGNLNLLYKFVQKNLPYPLASFHNKRSFLSIENLCFVIKLLIDRENIPSGIYNMADDEPLATTKIVEILAESLGKRPRFWHIPVKQINLLAKVGDFFNFPFNSERLKKMTENYVVCNEKIKSTLNIKLPIDSKDGLKLTADSFKSESN